MSTARERVARIAALTGMPCQPIAQVALEEIDRLAALLSDAKDPARAYDATCVHCGWIMTCGAADYVARARAHSLECKAHPAVAHAEELREAAGAWLAIHNEALKSREAAARLYASGAVPAAAEVLRATLAKNPNPSSQPVSRGFAPITGEASGLVGLGPDSVQGAKLSIDFNSPEVIEHVKKSVEPLQMSSGSAIPLGEEIGHLVGTLELVEGYEDSDCLTLQAVCRDLHDIATHLLAPQPLPTRRGPSDPDAERFRFVADMETEDDMPEWLYTAWSEGPEAFRRAIDEAIRSKRPAGQASQSPEIRTEEPK